MGIASGTNQYRGFGTHLTGYTSSCPSAHMVACKRNRMLHESLSRFYNNNNYIRKYLIPVTRKARASKSKTKLSLRILDWLVTNFSKKHRIEHNAVSNIHTSYRSHCRAYSKKLFDPFCRRERIVFSDGDSSITTTLGQLNFFRWIIVNDIMGYVVKNFSALEKDMVNTIHKHKINHTAKRRRELTKKSKHISQNYSKYDVAFK